MISPTAWARAATPAQPARTRSVVRPIAAGLAAGLAFGIAIRAWMRLVSTHPEFSWDGTGFIVGVFTILGLSAGVVTSVRHRVPAWVEIGVRVVGIGLGVGCFIGAGGGMLPTVLGVALALARPEWPRWLRVALVVIGACVAVALIWSLPDLTILRRGVGLAVYLPLCAVEAALFARLFAPTLPQQTLPRKLRVLAAIGAVLAVLLGAVAMGGIPGGA